MKLSQPSGLYLPSIIIGMTSFLSWYVYSASKWIINRTKLSTSWLLLIVLNSPRSHHRQECRHLPPPDCLVLLSPYPCEHSYPKLLSLGNYFYDQQLYRKQLYATPTAKAKSVSTDLLDLFQHFKKISVKALACSSAASEKLYSRTGNAYLWNSIVFQLRIILAEQRYKYIFFTNIFSNFFIVCRQTISHGFSFYGGRVRYIFHISVGGLFISGKFIVTLFRVGFVFNHCLFTVWPYMGFLPFLLL